MKIVSVGGGPAGLFFAILARKSFPEAQVQIYERNAQGDTFGWGVVFSDETLGNIAAADPESFAEIERSFKHWTDIETFVQGQKVVSTGHGFSGLSRKRLLQILAERAQSLGVQIAYDTPVENVTRHMEEADLVLGADGVNSAIREQFADHFQPSLDWRHCRFSWLGTDLELEAFTFIFKENEHGLWHVHAYPFEEGLSTFIVECHEDTWQRSGLGEADEETTVKYCEELFKEELAGHRLLKNRSIWRRFPTIRCKRWQKDNLVLMGDAVHTAHFSIGSGTKLAMEDAIILRDALVEIGTDKVNDALVRYQELREVDTLKLQKAAQTSLEWFERSREFAQDDPRRFTFSLMTRSKKITWQNLGLRDPALVASVAEQFAEAQRALPFGVPAEASLPPAFHPIQIAGLELANRVVVSPMCQYLAEDGVPNDWHLVHLGSRAVGGAGLLMTEMTNVSADGRITPGCTGLWNESQAAAWRRITDFVHAHSPAAIGVQLAHAGRKGSCHHPWEGSDDHPIAVADGGWPLIGASATPLKEGWPTPKAMDRADMDRVREAFVHSAKLAQAAGFDLIELHMAHGYLLSSFLSPAANFRTDDYGGSLENRLRFPMEVLRAVRAAWPRPKPLAIRLTASDWLEDGGQTLEETVAIAKLLEAAGADAFDISSGGNTPLSKPIYGRMYQVPFAEAVKRAVSVPVMAVGAIQNVDHVNTILAAGRADLCCLARPHLADPYLTGRAAAEAGIEGAFWPAPYLPGRPRPQAVTEPS